MIDLQNNSTRYLLGSPCKINKYGGDICGRYIGDSNLVSSEDVILLIGTPHNSIIHVKQIDACFDTTRDDLCLLKDFEEDAQEHSEWYHKSRPKEELDKIGVFISPSDITPIKIPDNT